MSDTSQLTTHELWIDGRQMTVTVQKLTATTLRVTWTVPTVTSAFNGFVIVLSEGPVSSANFPEDGKRYVASSNWAAPQDKIGEAQVIAAAYGFFNDDITVRTVDVSNVDTSKLYYASAHAASNILQYYPVGVQSYPLESSRFEKQSDTYAGSIPSSSTPPENPANGDAYYDKNTGQVLIWKDSTQAWIESTDKTVATGAIPPVRPNQIFFDQNDSLLKVFLLGQWVTCNSTNTEIKTGANSWTPLASVDSQYPETPVTGDVVGFTPQAAYASPPVPEVRVYTLGQWLLLTSNLVRVLGQNVIVGDPVIGKILPAVPQLGDFFYSQTTRDLLVWNGDDWTKADTDQEGTPTSDKINIGTDGSYDERIRLMKTLKGQMGWPKVCVELTEEQFNIAIDNALDEFRRRADNAYLHRHVLFTLQNNQQTYYLNDPRNKTDRIVNVLKIHRINMLGVTNLTTDNNLYAQALYHQFFQGAAVDTLSIHLVSQMGETFEKIFAGNYVYTWDEASRQLEIHRRIQANKERVILEVAMERSEQELLLDRWSKQWIQGWAHAELKEMLGMIRSKYGSVAGPNGGLTLNGDMLISEARQDFDELLRQMLDYEVGNGGVNFGNTSFLIG